MSDESITRAVEAASSAAHAAGIAALANKFGWGGTVTAVLGWVVSSEFGVLVGVLLGVGGFLVTAYYKHREDKRKQEIHKLRIKMYLEGKTDLGPLDQED